MAIWITADLHLDHENIIKYCDRPFENAQEMAHKMLGTINTMCSPTDELYVLGDFAWNPDAFRKYAGMLVPKTTFVKGNHDYGQSEMAYALKLKHNKRKYFLCHYPLASLAPSWTNLHGHAHGNMPEQPGWRLDVGVDEAYRLFGEYQPFNIFECEMMTRPLDRRDEYEQEIV